MLKVLPQTSPGARRKFRLWSERPAKRHVGKIHALAAQRLQVSVSEQDLSTECLAEPNFIDRSELLSRQRSGSAASSLFLNNTADGNLSSSSSADVFDESDECTTSRKLKEIEDDSESANTVKDEDFSAKTPVDLRYTTNRCKSENPLLNRKPNSILTDPKFQTKSYDTSVPGKQWPSIAISGEPHSFRKKFAPTATCFVCKESFGLGRALKCKKCRVKVHPSCKGKIGANTCGFADKLRALLAWAGQENHGLFQPNAAPVHHKHTDEGIACSSKEESPSTFYPESAEPASLERISDDGTVDEELKQSAESAVAQPRCKLSRQDTGFEEEDALLQPAKTKRTLSRQETSLDKCRKRSFQLLAGLQTSMEWAKESWDDVTIPLESIEFRDEYSLIGIGRFGEVHKGYYHMDVALKLLNMDHVEMENQLETFRDEVRIMMSTRHENIVLFIGCCLVLPYLGIVMDYCKGATLHEIIHIEENRWTLFRREAHIAIAIQLCQGMSYLHCKKILHKDLRSKNVFYQYNRQTGTIKVIISDFGIFSCRRLFGAEDYTFGCSKVILPRYWLQYQSPEIIRNLNAPTGTVHSVRELGFSNASDIFAFGSVYFELITSEFPYCDLAAHQIMWRVGHGSFLPLKHPSLDFDDRRLLSCCWEFDSEKRPQFTHLSRRFEAMELKTRLRGRRSLQLSP